MDINSSLEKWEEHLGFTTPGEVHGISFSYHPSGSASWALDFAINDWDCFKNPIIDRRISIPSEDGDITGIILREAKEEEIEIECLVDVRLPDYHALKREGWYLKNGAEIPSFVEIKSKKILIFPTFRYGGKNNYKQFRKEVRWQDLPTTIEVRQNRITTTEHKALVIAENGNKILEIVRRGYDEAPEFSMPSILPLKYRTGRLELPPYPNSMRFDFRGKLLKMRRETNLPNRVAKRRLLRERSIFYQSKEHKDALMKYKNLCDEARDKWEKDILEKSEEYSRKFQEEKERYERDYKEWKKRAEKARRSQR